MNPTGVPVGVGPIGIAIVGTLIVLTPVIAAMIIRVRRQGGFKFRRRRRKNRR